MQPFRRDLSVTGCVEVHAERGEDLHDVAAIAEPLREVDLALLGSELNGVVAR
jgi:hypothetical protein